MLKLNAYKHQVVYGDQGVKWLTLDPGMQGLISDPAL